MRLIDADALLDKVQDYGEGQERLMLIDPYWVRNAPTISIPVAELDTTEDFGEWIDRSDGGRIRYPFWERYECSKCGAKSEDTNFCPNCGADMRGEEE